MGFDSPVHWLIVIAVIALLFGGSRVGNLMGELGKGIKAFKSNLNDSDSNSDSSGQSGTNQNGTTENASARIASETPAAAPQNAAKPEAAREPATAESGADHGDRR